MSSYRISQELVTLLHPQLLLLSMCFSIASGTFICKSHEFIFSFRSKDHQPLNPPIEEIRTEVVESGQKRQINTAGVNGCIPRLFVIRLTKTHLNTMV